MDKVTETTFSLNMIKCRRCGEMWWFRKGQEAEHLQLRATHEDQCVTKKLTNNR
jgi:hypothetical protein